jgi:hypothetical protein
MTEINRVSSFQILLLLGSVMMSVAVSYGFGTSDASVSAVKQVLAVMYYCIATGFCIFSTTIARVAFILYLITFLGNTRLYRVIFMSLIVMQLLINLSSFLLLFLQCGSDVQAVFNSNLPQTDCMSLTIQLDYAYFAGGKASPFFQLLSASHQSANKRPVAFNSATDLFLAIFPAAVFWNLKLRLRVKISLICLLSLGLL